MAAIRLPNDFKESLRLLNEKQVEYLLLDGFTVGYHSYPRTTADVDIGATIYPQKQPTGNYTQGVRFQTSRTH
jgi:hypothetical protein